MNLVRNLFSSLISAVLVLALGVLIFVFSILSVVQNRDFILSTLEKNNTYKILATEIVPKVLVFALTQRFVEQNPDQNIADKLAQKLDKTTFENLSADLKKIVEDSYSFAILEKEQFEVRLELKNYLPSLQQNLTTAVASLQTEGQLQGLDTAELNAGLAEANQASIYITQDKIEVSGLKELDSREEPNKESFLRQARVVLERINQTQSLLIIATLVLALALFATRLPHFLSGLKWLATTIISAAFFPLILGFLLLIIKPVDLVSRFLKEQESVANFSAAVDLVSANLQTITEKVFFNVLIVSGSLILLAITLHIVVFFLTPRSKHST